MIYSYEKIIERYFAAVTLAEFTYKGKLYKPKPLRVSEEIFFQRMTCVEKCGACCHRFSLDYLPSEVDRIKNENAKTHLTLIELEFNGSLYSLWTDTQTDNTNHSCRHLNMENGRCGIHLSHPFSCDFELLRFHHFEDENTPNQLGHRPFGRGWNMKRIDGEKGALCQWYEAPCDKSQIEDMARKLSRLLEWANHFSLTTSLPAIIDWVKKGPHTKPLLVGSPPKSKGFF